MHSTTSTDTQINIPKACLVEETLTTEEAAKQLTAHLEASPTPVELQQWLAGLWTLLNDTAVYLPSSQPKVIAILQTIRTFPKIDEPRGDDEDVFDFHDGFIWRELTNWANDWADNFNHHASNYFLEACRSDEEKAARREAWIGANAYTARLAATGDEPLSSYGVGPDRASTTFVDALEFEHEPKSERERDILNLHVECAAQLFIYAAGELYRRCKDGYSEPLRPISTRESKVRAL